MENLFIYKKMTNKNKKTIVEHELGIKGDYQFKALHGNNYLQSNWHANKWAVIGTLLNGDNTKRVLDLGTGSGNFELLFYSKFDEIVGVDYNDNALNFLRKMLKHRKISNVVLKKHNLLTLSSVKGLGTFDLIILIDVIEHLDKSAQSSIIKSLRKLLNKGGRVVIVTPNYGGFWPVIEKAVDRFTSIPHLEDIQHITKFDKALLHDLFAANGFATRKISTFNTFSYIAPVRSLSTWAAKKEVSLALPFGNLLLGVFEK